MVIETDVERARFRLGVGLRDFAYGGAGGHVPQPGRNIISSRRCAAAAAVQTDSLCAAVALELAAESTGGTRGDEGCSALSCIEEGDGGAEETRVDITP